MITLQPTVVIGLGSSGAQIVEGIQQKMYEMFKLNSLPIFKYIVIETNRNYGADATPSGKDVEVLSLSSGGVGNFRNFLELLDQLENQDVHPDWIDRDFAQNLVAQGEGAGGVRPVGRLILWANMSDVRSAIYRAKEEVLRDSSIQESRKLLAKEVVGQKDFRIGTTKKKDPEHAHAVVCGTSTGGTYSGGFIDLGYLCQHVLEIPEGNRQSLFSIMLLPPRQMSDREPGELHRFKANAYGTLLEAKYFSEQKSHTDRVYDADLPNLQTKFEKVVPPFDYSYLISQEYGGGALSISTPGALCQLASLKLFCDLMGLESTRSERIVDRISAGQDPTTTFGLAAIMHPQYQISEYAACDAGVELCQRWTDEDTYVNNAGQEHSVPPASTLETKARNLWEGQPEDGQSGLLTEKMDQLTAQEAELGFSAEELKEDVNRLEEDRMEAVLRSFLEPGDTYYGRIKRNVPSVGNRLSEELEEEVMQELEEKQSIPYAISYAEALRAAADELLDFWDDLGVPSEHEAWNDYVSGELYRRLDRTINDPLDRLQNLWTTRSDLAESILDEAVSRLKVHLLRPRIEDIKEDLQSVIDRLSRHQEMMRRAQETLEARKAKIQNDIEDDSLPIGLVWVKGSFEDDVEEVVRRIARPRPSASDLADSGYAPTSGTQWLSDKIQEWHDADENQATGQEARGTVAAEKIKLAYQEKAMQAIERDFDVDLSVSLQKEMVNQYLRRGKQCHLRYKRPDGKKRSIGEYLIGPEEAVTKNVRQKIKQGIGSEFDDEHTIGLPGIDHMLLFYREEAVGSALDVLTDADNMQECFEEPPTDPGIKDWVRDNWTDLRIAYDVPARLDEEEEQVRQEEQERELHDLLQIVGTFLFRWEKQGSDWVPVEVREAAGDLSLSVDPPQDGGPPRPRWVVKLPKVPTRGYTVVDAQEEPREETILRLVDDPQTARKVLEDGKNTLRVLRREGKLDDIWEERVKDRITRRFGQQEAVREARHYFGDDNSDGAIDRLLTDGE